MKALEGLRLKAEVCGIGDMSDFSLEGLVQDGTKEGGAKKMKDKGKGRCS